MMTLWLLAALAVAAVLLAGAIVAVRHFGTDARSRRSLEVLEVLEERYASGEIDEKEYRQVRRVLHG